MEKHINIPPRMMDRLTDLNGKLNESGEFYFESPNELALHVIGLYLQKNKEILEPEPD